MILSPTSETAMSYSREEWENTYRRGDQDIRWPWSNVVSYAMNYVRPRSGLRVLELGCGSGANIPFFRSMGCEYHSIEGSPTCVERIWGAYPDLREHVHLGDFTRAIPIAGQFDLIFDRGALTCNTTTAIRDALVIVHGKLKPSGKYIGIDWFSTQDAEFQRGEPAEDPNTRTGYVEGGFAGQGRIHFSDAVHIMDLFQQFTMIALRHTVTKAELPRDGLQHASWNLVAEK